MREIRFAVDFRWQAVGPSRIDAYGFPAPADVLPSAPRLQTPHFDRFVTDGHLGKLARNLRLLGLDTVYARDADDRRLLEVMASGKSRSSYAGSTPAHAFGREARILSSLDGPRGADRRKFCAVLDCSVRPARSPRLPAVWNAMGCLSLSQKPRSWSDWPESHSLCATTMTTGCAQRAAGFTGREPISTNSPAASPNLLGIDGERARPACTQAARRTTLFGEPSNTTPRTGVLPGTRRAEVSFARIPIRA